LYRSTQHGAVGPGQIEKGDVPLGRSDLDLQAWTRALCALPAAPVTESDVLAWVEEPLRQFFPFDKFWLAYGNLSGGRIRMLSLLSSGHSPEFLSSRKPEFDLKTRGCFAWWVSNRKPFILDKRGALGEAGLAILATKPDLEEIERFSFGVVAAHGVIDPFVNAGTYISFAGVPRTQPKRTLAALDLIAPVLHALYLATKKAAVSAVDLTGLTDRQRELVNLAIAGLSDKAIALRLAISDHTVGNHFRTIYAKLGISKRSQLISLLK
jgi:DNA-binding CsgD family transcriptional regulator